MAMASDPAEWSVEEVGEWAEVSGFAVYKSCFVTNFINGRKLMTVDASTLSKLGCTDFTDMTKLSQAIRNLFGTTAPKFSDSVADHAWSPQRVLDGCIEGYGQPR
eukprot:m.416500 g.416500  ORF g.416500 m.416500 type:complete len:105 (+) comp30002_c0_seq1:186-500(+)